MKKKIIIVIAAICLIAIAVVAGVKLYSDSRTRKITDFYDNDVSTIQKVTIRKAGKDDIVVPKEYYEEVTEYLSKMSFPGVFRGGKYDGWSYIIVIETAEKSISITPLGNRCEIDKKVYNLEGCDEDFLRELYERCMNGMID